MSADPDAPADPSRRSGGHVVKNMIYKHNGSNLEIITGWQDQGTRELNQEIVPPAKMDIHPQHPCWKLNAALLACSFSCPEEMRLAGRVASCNDERHALMQCFTKERKWAPTIEPKPWYKFW